MLETHKCNIHGANRRDKQLLVQRHEKIIYECELFPVQDVWICDAEVLMHSAQKQEEINADQPIKTTNTVYICKCTLHVATHVVP